MRRLRALWMRFRGLCQGQQADNDFAAEVKSHVAMHTEDGIRAGLSLDEARRQALVRLGGVEQVRGFALDELGQVVEMGDGVFGGGGGQGLAVLLEERQTQGVEPGVKGGDVGFGFHGLS